MFSETEIIEGCKKGITEFQGIIYKKYAPMMMAICRRYSGNYEEARDLMHDGFLKVFLNIKNYRYEATLQTWISRIMINNILNSFRNKIKIERMGSKLVKEAEEVSDEILDDSYVKDYSIEEINTAIQQLTVGQRTVFNLYTFENFAHKEISNQLGITEGTSKSQLAKARISLREILTGKDKGI